MRPSLSQQGFKNIIKNKTCFKSLEGSCIDLILTSRPNLHQDTLVFESGMCDHHLMVYAILKSTYTKLEPKVLHKRQYQNFSKESFPKDLKFGLINNGIFSHFNNESKEILDHHAPIKQAKLRGNKKVIKVLRKEIMTK